jgi:hypothetical protein
MQLAEELYQYDFKRLPDGFHNRFLRRYIQQRITQVLAFYI